MELHKATIVCLLLICVFGLTQVRAQCGECMPNSVQCINERQFYLCQRGRPSNTINSCAEDEVCTSSPEICVKRDEVVGNTFVCEDKCNKCQASSDNFNALACVSATQYVRCSNNAPSNVVGSCETGEYCSIDHYTKFGIICVPQCVLNYWEFETTCSNAIFTTTTTVAPTVVTQAPNPTSLRQQCIDGKPSTPRPYFYMRNKDDFNCISFLYCEERNGIMDFVLLTCRSGYYDEATNSCKSTRPDSCTPTPAPTTARTVTPTTPSTEQPTSPTTTQSPSTAAPTVPTQTTPAATEQPTTPTTTQSPSTAAPTVPTQTTPAATEQPTIPTTTQSPSTAAPTIPTQTTPAATEQPTIPTTTQSPSTAAPTVTTPTTTSAPTEEPAAGGEETP